MGSLLGRHHEAVFDPLVAPGVLSRLHIVDDIVHDAPVDLPMDHVSLELLHVPCAVDFEVSPEFQEAAIRHEERAALDRQQDQGPLVRREVLGEEREPIRVPLRGSCQTDECGPFEGLHISHSFSDDRGPDEGSRRRTGTLKRTATLTIPVVVPAKLEEAKIALERGEFEQALRLVADAHAERPDDPEIRELYAATHLARAIRLSNKAREARRLDLLRREIDYDVEFQDSSEIAKVFDDALYAIEDVLRVEPGHWKALMLRAALVFRRDRTSGRPEALQILRALAEAEPTNKQVPFMIRKVERPCERCGDTGFCPHCKGRGERRFLRIDRKCDRCYGRGICPVCGVL